MCAIFFQCVRKVVLVHACVYIKHVRGACCEYSSMCVMPAVSARVPVCARAQPGTFHDTPDWTANLARLVLAVVVVCKNVAGGHAVWLLKGAG